MKNQKQITIKKYLTNTNALLAIMGTAILLWITSSMSWVTGVTGASSTVTDAADSVSSFFGLGDTSGSDALASMETTTTGNLWNFISDGEKTSTSIGIFFILFVVVLIVLALLAFSKQTKGLKTATGIFGIISSFIFLFIALGYAGILETMSESTSSSFYGLASTEFKYNLGYKFFILLAIILLVLSIFTLITRSKGKKFNS